MTASPNTAPVYLFNCADEVNYTAWVNGGGPVVVYATSDSSYWSPGTSDNPVNLFLDLGTSRPGSFNLGDNSVVIQTGKSSNEWTIDIPVDPPGDLDAAQLYFFFKTYDDRPQWVFLVDGQIVAGDAALR